MSAPRPIAIGPYRFTATDARRTLTNLPDWWSQLAQGRDVDDLSSIAARLAELSIRADDEQLGASLVEAWGLLAEAASTLRATGRTPVGATGRVAQLNTSDGGVPKSPVDAVEVGWRGLVGDRQAARVHHGRPWQALCLWSAEVIDALVAEGHPVFPGAAGENVTIEGLDWAQVRPGLRLRIGTVLCETSMFSLPCFKNKAWFLGGDFDRMHHDRGPWSRIYATVIEPGRIATGDLVTIVP